MSKAFAKVVEWLHAKRHFNAGMLSEKEPRALVEETFNVLQTPLKDLSISQEIPPELTAALEENVFIFSGFKTYHELKEASMLLKDENGGFKPFDRFRQDVEAIDSTYNRNYLAAEYEFAVASSQMAVKWKELEKDGDRYDLQYRTAGDDRVRPEHAALNGITLPPSDKFWDEYYPPNGWRCRCTAVQVRRGKYPESDPAEAAKAGERATTQIGKDGTNKGKIFRFNPGKQEKIFPPKHPYLPKSCSTCPFGGTDTFSAGKDCGNCRKRKKVMDSADKQNEEINSIFKKIQSLEGSEYNKELQKITELGIFKPYDKDNKIFWAGSSDGDLDNLLECARKAVKHGNVVYILPNPNSAKTPDFIFKRNNTFKDYDLKSISGDNSVGNRLIGSIGQTRRVLLNMKTNYSPRRLAKEIQNYFNSNKDAIEVLIYKNRKKIFVERYNVDSKNFMKNFISLWYK